jgi:hypothetical protein
LSSLAKELAGPLHGLYIGLVQVTVFFVTGSHIVLPIFGLITGGTTDWIALHMIFGPIEPGKRLFGIMPWQGVFHKLRRLACRHSRSTPISPLIATASSTRSSTRTATRSG